MVFGSNSRLTNLPAMSVCIGKNETELVQTFKYLGVHLDSRLSFDYYINQVYILSSKKVGALRKTREHVDQPTALMLHKSFVLPHLLL